MNNEFQYKFFFWCDNLNQATRLIHCITTKQNVTFILKKYGCLPTPGVWDTYIFLSKFLFQATSRL